MTSKKLTKTEKESNLLAENVRVLRCGNYGYIRKGIAIFKSADLFRVNLFAEFANRNDTDFRSELVIKKEAKEWQSLETNLFIPNQLPNTKGEKIITRGNNYGAVIRQKY